MRARRGDEVSLLPVQHIAHSRHSAFTFPPRGIEASGSKQEPHVSHKNKKRDRIPVVVLSAAAHGQTATSSLGIRLWTHKSNLARTLRRRRISGSTLRGTPGTTSSAIPAIAPNPGTRAKSLSPVHCALAESIS